MSLRNWQIVFWNTQFLVNWKYKLQAWLDKGWLLLYPKEELNLPKELIVIMQKKNKRKVHSIMDFQELNTYVDSNMVEEDICMEKLRE